MAPTSTLRRWAPALTLSLALLSPAARAELAPAQAEALMQQAGLGAQMDTVAQQFRMTIDGAMQEPGRDLSPAQREALAARTAARVTGATLRPRLRDALARQVPAADLPALETWFTSPTGRRVVALQQKAAADAMRTDLDPERPMRVLAATTGERFALLNQLVERSRSAELQVMLFERIVPALRQLTEAVKAGGGRVDPGDDTPANPAMVPAMHGALRAQHAAEYETLSDEELQRWIDFLGTPVGQRWTAATLKANVALPLAVLADLAAAP